MNTHLDLGYSLLIAAAESEHSNPLIPETNELIYGAIAFLILFVILSKAVFPKLNVTLSERSRNIEGKLEEAENERAAARKLQEQYKQKLNEAHAEAARIVEQARANADRLETELRAKAEDQAAKIIERANQSIVAERDRAIQSLNSEVGNLAVDLAERVVGNSLDKEHQLKLVDQYLADLGATAK